MSDKKYITILMDYGNMKYNGSTVSDQNNNANGISDTLAQGLQFQKYLKKISGFGDESGVSIEPYQNMSEDEIKRKQDELSKLKEEYIALVANFESYGNTLRTGYSDYLNTIPNSTYTNKHVSFAGQNGYVTKNGVFKTYTGDGTTFNNVNGCPSTLNRTSVTGVSVESILKEKGLTQGNPMQDGQSCGDEGTNVFVTQSTASGITYKGCYQASDTTLSSMSLQPGGPIFNVNSCKWRAVNTGAATFALRNYDETSKKASCYTNKTEVSPTQLGNTYVGKDLLTSANTPVLSGTFTPPYKMRLINGGFISIFDSTSSGAKLVKQIPDTGKADCKMVPVITNVYVSTALTSNLIDGAKQSSVNNALNPQNATSFSFTVKQLYDALNITTPAPSYILRYSYNTTPSTATLSSPITITSNATTNATDVIPIPAYSFPVDSSTTASCNARLILQDNGDMQVNAGSVPTSGTAINFSTLKNDVTSSVSMTHDILQKLYPGCVDATNANSISNTQSLELNHYIKSTNGKLVLIMQPDGNLCLKTFTQQFKCINNAVDSELYGDADSYTLYNFNSPMDNSNVGKLAYIDDEGLSHAYPASMIMREPNSYQHFMNYDSPGNNIENMPIQNSNNNYCKSASNALETSGGYVYDNNTKKCWIKNSSFNLATPKTYVEGSYVNVKTPIPMVPASCSDTITEIDSTRWNKYKTSTPMASSFSCGASRRYSSAQRNMRSIEDQLYNMAVDIIGKINDLQSQGVTLTADMTAFKTQLEASIVSYNDNADPKVINNENVINSALSGMMSDVDLMVLRENSRYLFLSIFAVGALVVALNAIKK